MVTKILATLAIVLTAAYAQAERKGTIVHEKSQGKAVASPQAGATPATPIPTPTATTLPAKKLAKPVASSKGINQSGVK